MLLVKRALDSATFWHRDQKRKYPGGNVPYASHVAGVAAILSRHGFDEEVVAAGALHDVVEDCGVTYEELTTKFGERVSTLVRHVSEEDKRASWEERKARYLDHFGTKPWEAQAISLADKIDNFESIIVCSHDWGDPWPMFKRGKDKQIERFDALLAKARELPPHALITEYAARLDEVRKV